MKYLKRFDESYQKSEEFYQDVVNKLYDEVDSFFKAKDRYFPLKVVLRKAESGYGITICMGGGWVCRMNDEEQDWLENLCDNYTKRYNLLWCDMCGDSGGGRICYTIRNSQFPEDDRIDYFSMPPNPFPERDN